MSYMGDFKVAAVIDKKFTTRSFTTGAPTTLAGTPAISIYKDNDTTQTTTGITLTVDFDGVTGLHNIHVDTSNAFYAAGSNFQMVITTGTVGGVSVVGEVVGSFSIEATSALRPTVAGRTLDVSATGEAGIDFANIGAPTTVVNLSGTTIKTATDIATATTAIQADTDDIQTRLPAALTADGNIKADALRFGGQVVTAAAGVTVPSSIASPTNITAGTITTATNVTTVNGLAANVITATAIAADAITAAKIADGAIDAATFAAGAIDATAIAANAIGASELAQDAAQEIADEVLNRNLAGAGSGNTRNVRNALRVLRNKVDIAAGTATVYQEDDSTSAWTATVTTAAGNPISTVDPA